MSDLLKSALNDSKMADGVIVESRPPRITRSSAAVRKLKLNAAISNGPVKACTNFLRQR
jgi:hypothetical protein